LLVELKIIETELTVTHLYCNNSIVVAVAEYAD